MSQDVLLTSDTCSHHSLPTITSSIREVRPHTGSLTPTSLFTLLPLHSSYCNTTDTHTPHKHSHPSVCVINSSFHTYLRDHIHHSLSHHTSPITPITLHTPLPSCHTYHTLPLLYVHHPPPPLPSSAPAAKLQTGVHLCWHVSCLGPPVPLGEGSSSQHVSPAGLPSRL